MYVDEKQAGEVTPALDEASQALLAIALYIERNGLSMGGAEDCYGRHCIVAAKNMLHYSGRVGDIALERLFIRYLGPKFMTVVNWSDSMGAQGRGAEVVQVLRDVAYGG